MFKFYRKQLTRKRKRNIEEWKQNMRRKSCQAGKPYIDVKGNFKPGRHLRINVKDCTRCRFKCSNFLTVETREEIHRKFWNLNDNEKLHFFNKNVERQPKARKRSQKENNVRNYSYFYYFHTEGNKIRVCKSYFLSTLDISQRRISYFFEKKISTVTQTPSGYEKGKHTKKAIKEETKDIVRMHIESFPRVQSHYCRNDTKKEYLEANLTLRKMYEMYLELCTENQYDPVKDNIYRSIFSYEFNISFVSPKKDRCDVCEEAEKKKRASSRSEFFN